MEAKEQESFLPIGRHPLGSASAAVSLGNARRGNLRGTNPGTGGCSTYEAIHRGIGACEDAGDGGGSQRWTHVSYQEQDGTMIEAARGSLVAERFFYRSDRDGETTRSGRDLNGGQPSRWPSHPLDGE